MRNRFFSSVVAAVGASTIVMVGARRRGPTSPRLRKPTFGGDRSGASSDAGDATASAGAPLGDPIEGQIAIDVRDDASPTDFADLARDTTWRCAPTARGVRPTTSWRSATSTPPAKAPSSKRSRATRGRARGADGRLSRDLRPQRSLYGAKQWHLRRVGAEKAWGYTCGQGVTVAVVDTGIACFDRAPSPGTDLAGTRCEGGWNFVTDTREATTTRATDHVAGTIAQTTNNGVGPPGSRSALADADQGPQQAGVRDVANVAEGIRFAADKGRRSSTSRSAARSRAAS